MHDTRTLARRGTLLLLATLLLSAACGGKSAAPPPAGGAAGAPLGRAEGTLAGTAPAAALAPAAQGSAAAVAPPAAPSATASARPAPPAAPPAAVQASAGSADPCRVATKEELEMALGFALRPGERKTGPIGDAECVYKTQNSQDPGTLPDVRVAIYRSRLAGTTYDEVRKASSRGTDVPGLGDKAYVIVGSGLLDIREVHVLKGDVLLSIELDVAAGSSGAARMSEEEKRTKLIALARTALARL